MSIFPDKEWRSEVKREQQHYDTSLKALVLRYDSYFMGSYLKWLRRAEWHDSHKALINKLIGGGCKMLLRHYGRITGFQIGLHCCDFGIRFYHWGWCIINSHARIGKNVVLYPGVCIGQKGPGVAPIIGDNCFLGLSCKVMGNVRIGNNVIVAPNAVVTKDVPDNCIVGGIPARVIRRRE